MNRALALAVVVVALLAGCATTPPESTPTPIAEAPTPTPTVQPIVAPTPYLDTTCADLIPQSTLDSVLTESSSLSVLPLAAELSWGDNPLSFALRQRGGFSCEWSNGFELTDNQSSDHGFVGAHVTILPAAETRWKDFAPYVDPATGRADNCSESEGYVTCDFEQLKNGSWVRLELRGVNAAADSSMKAMLKAARPASQALVDALEAATPTDVVVQHPEGTLPLEMSCDQFATDKQLAAILGTQRGTDSGGGYSQEYASWLEAKTNRCYDAFGDTDINGNPSIYITWSWLAAGEWAFKEAVDAGYIDDSKPLDIEGLAANDRAFMTCVSDLSCTANLVVGHNWIRYELDQPEGVQSPDASSKLSEVAALVVANLYA